MTKIFGNVSEIKMRRKNLLYHHLIVDESHRVIYCYIPKVACTQLKRIFIVLNNESASVTQLDHQETHSRQNLVFLSDKKYSEEQRQQMLTNFYKFMIVRDPLERLLSAWKEKLKGQIVASLWLEAIARHVRVYRNYPANEISLVQNVTFHEYIGYLTDEMPLDLNEHFMRFNVLCSPCDVHYDFISLIDNLQRDLNYLAKQINLNRETHFIQQKSSIPQMTTKKSTASYFKSLPKIIFHKLINLYKLDHELFGFSLPTYETLDERI
ncbi:carbohydrate sulfotransferase 14-like isoform X2 [Dendronephthya gigantea]|nr:carbohydrate sulfotransferase 14-like isoform X2 [Dendronephthya gigantea]